MMRFFRNIIFILGCFLLGQFYHIRLLKLVEVVCENKFKELAFSGRCLPCMAPLPIKNPGDKL